MKCFICGAFIPDTKEYYEEYGNCCVVCDKRCGNVAKGRITQQMADIQLKIRLDYVKSQKC